MNCTAKDGTGYFTLEATHLTRTVELFKSYRNGVYILNGGTGDIGAGNTAAATLDTMRRMAQACRDVGADAVIACTIPAWTTAGGAGMTVAMNTVRQALNASIIAQAGNPAYWDAYVDIANLPEIVNPLNTTYFDADGIHPNQAGHTAEAAAIKTVLSSVLQTLSLPNYKG